MEVDLYRWVLEKRELGLEVNDTDIREKAKEIVGDGKFRASKGWCYKFRKRFRLVSRAVTHTCKKITFTEEEVVRTADQNCIVKILKLFSLQEKHLQFHLFIEDYIYNRKVPLSRVYNIDQTPMRVVFPAKKTISPKGLK